MTTSIIVAAIPFPDAAAEDGTTSGNNGNTVKIEYGVTDSDVSEKFLDYASELEINVDTVTLMK